MSAKGIYVAQECHVVNLIPPVSLNATTTSNKFNMKNWRHATIIHVAFLTGEQAFRFMLRLDGQPTWKKPLTPYQGSALKSPFVTLAARP
jgi:hypothetical protein